jgi:cyclopropane fatty-acyl-phospholipid synthase-like methyltransferase
MGPLTPTERLAKRLPPSLRGFIAARTGSHRQFVGPGDLYDASGALQFSLLALLGLREEHRLLDIGCGSLRAGRLFITYLQPDRYFGIEPERWLVEAAIRAEIGQALVDLKRPTFAYRDDFRLTVFGESFDFLLAASVFTHAALHQIRTCLREARQVMGPSALLLASAACGASDYEGDTWVYPEAVTYTLQRLQAVAAEEGLTCEPVDYAWVNPTRTYTWLAFARR